MENFKDIRGFPGYKIDIERGIVINKDGFMRNISNRKSFMMKRNGAHYRVTRNRVLYAAEHGIDPWQIPSEYVVVENGGKYELIERVDLVEFPHRKRREYNSNHLQIIDRKMKELTIMKDYYTNGNMREIFIYINQQKQFIINKYIRVHCVAKETAQQLFEEALVVLQERILSPTNTLTELTYCLFGLMYKVRKKKVRTLNIEDYSGIKRRLGA